MTYWDCYTHKDLKIKQHNDNKDLLSNDGYRIRFLHNRTRAYQQYAISFYIKTQLNISNVIKYFDFDLISANMDLLNFKNTTFDKDKNWIRFIHNPTEEQQLESVIENPLSLMYIDFAFESVEIKAVELNAYDCIRYCKSDSAKKAALQKDGLAIIWLDNPSEEYQVLALDQNPGSLRYIKDPSLNSQNFFIEKLINSMINQKDNKKEMKMFNEFSKKLDDSVREKFIKRVNNDKLV